MELYPCPWCLSVPTYIEDINGVEVWCLNKFCRAKPKICTFRNYTKAQVAVVWNSYYNNQQKK